MRKIDVLRPTLLGYLLLFGSCRPLFTSRVEGSNSLPESTQAGLVETPPGTRTAPSNLEGTARPQLHSTFPTRTAEVCSTPQPLILDSGAEIDPSSLSWQLFTPETPPITGGNDDDFIVEHNLVGDPDAGLMIVSATHVAGQEPNQENIVLHNNGAVVVIEQVHKRPINILDPEVEAKLLASGISPEEINKLKEQILSNPARSIDATNHYGYRFFRQNCDGTVESAFVAPDVIGIQLELILPTPESRRPMNADWLSLYPGVGQDFTS